VKIYATGLTWGEGPRWSGEALWVSDPQGGTLCHGVEGSWTVEVLTSQSNGLWFLPDGRLAGSIMRENRIGIWDGKDFAPYVDLSELATGPLGDLVGDAAGGLYVDDVGFAAHLGEDPKPGRLIYVDPHGDARVAAEGIEFPNGLALIDDGRTLVVAETWEQRLTAFSVGPDGSLTEKRPYADLSQVVGPEARPDGICAAPQGGVWVSTLTGHAVARIDGDSLLDLVSTGDGFPIACCTDGDTRLWVTVADGGGLPVMEAVANKSVKTTVQVFDTTNLPASLRASA
jgi:sugar lactone lactonase YvrE